MSNHTVDIIETWVQRVRRRLHAARDRVDHLALGAPAVQHLDQPIRTFLDDTVSPYVGVFRRWVPTLGPLDLSPMIAIIVLQVGERILMSVLDGFRPG